MKIHFFHDIMILLRSRLTFFFETAEFLVKWQRTRIFLQKHYSFVTLVFQKRTQQQRLLMDNKNHFKQTIENGVILWSLFMGLTTFLVIRKIFKESSSWIVNVLNYILESQVFLNRLSQIDATVFLIFSHKSWVF